MRSLTARVTHLPWAVGQVENALRGIAKLSYQPAKLDAPDRRDHAQVTRGSALSRTLPDASVDAIMTDPPYYDNVMYAECSDYFYVWLKRSLREPRGLSSTDLVFTDKEDEVVANPSLFKDVAVPAARGRRKAGEGKTAVELADAHYEGLAQPGRSGKHLRVLKPAVC